MNLLNNLNDLIEISSDHAILISHNHLYHLYQKQRVENQTIYFKKISLK